MTFRLGSVLVLSVLRLSGNSGVAEAEMASKRIQKELKDLQKDPPTSCSAGHNQTLKAISTLVYGLTSTTSLHELSLATIRSRASLTSFGFQKAWDDESSIGHVCLLYRERRRSHA